MFNFMLVPIPIDVPIDLSEVLTYCGLSEVSAYYKKKRKKMMKRKHL